MQGLFGSETTETVPWQLIPPTEQMQLPPYLPGRGGCCYLLPTYPTIRARFSNATEAVERARFLGHLDLAGASY